MIANSKNPLRYNKLPNLLVVSSIISLIFLIFYFTFFLTSLYFRFYPTISKDELNSWVWPVVSNKGLEIYVLFFGTILYLFLVYFLINNYKLIPFIKNKVIQFLLAGVLIGKIFTTYPSKILGVNKSLTFNILIFLTSILFIWGSFFIVRKINKLNTFKKILILTFSWSILFLLVVLSIQKASYTDFSFFTSPAIRISQGLKFPDFFMVYGLLEMYIFTLLTKFHFNLGEMQFVLGVITVIWFFIYWRVATRFIKNTFLVYLFLLSLVIFRFFGLEFHSLEFPQANALRLDFWLPLFYVFCKFRSRKMLTSFAFSIGYIFEDFFGFMFLVLYIGYRLVETLKSSASIKYYLRSIFQIFCLPVVAVLVHLYLFNSIFSTGAHIINKLKFWQMVISPYSLYWPFLIIFGFFLFFTINSNIQKRRELLFLLGLTLLNLIYFFGRSHDHNILTQSGSLLLISFITLNELSKYLKTYKISYILASFFIITINILFSDYIIGNFKTIYRHIQDRTLIEENELDKIIDNNPMFFNQFGTDKIYIMGNNYLDYRYNINSVGYYSPFIASVYKKDTIELVRKLYDDGYVILIEQGKWGFNLDEYNESAYMREHNLSFEAKDSSSLGNISFSQLIIHQKR